LAEIVSDMPHLQYHTDISILNDSAYEFVVLFSVILPAHDYLMCPLFDLFCSNRPTNNDMREAAQAIVQLFPVEKLVRMYLGHNFFSLHGGSHCNKFSGVNRCRFE
jgi:hypothetical protein